VWLFFFLFFFRYFYFIYIFSLSRSRVSTRENKGLQIRRLLSITTMCMCMKRAMPYTHRTRRKHGHKKGPTKAQRAKDRALKLTPAHHTHRKHMVFKGALGRHDPRRFSSPAKRWRSEGSPQSTRPPPLFFGRSACFFDGQGHLLWEFRVVT